MDKLLVVSVIDAARAEKAQADGTCKQHHDDERDHDCPGAAGRMPMHAGAIRLEHLLEGLGGRTGWV